MNKTFFYLGLALFYLIIFFAPHKLVYFSAYFIAVFFFYLSTKKLSVALVYSLILSFFSEVGLAASLFLVEPRELQLGAGYVIKPLTMILLCLLPFSIRTRGFKFSRTDMILFLFYLLCILNIFFFPSTNVFYNILTISELLLAYFILRIHLSKTMVKHIFILLISMLLFQSLLSSLQYVRHRPLGALTETSTEVNPYGVTAPEDENIFRSTGTFYHPNLLTAFLLTTIPFHLFGTIAKTKKIIFITLSVFALFTTQSRLAWLFFSLFFLLLVIRRFKTHVYKFRGIPKKSILLITVSFAAVLLVFGSNILVRLDTIAQSFSETGSWGVRIKTYEEAINLITQSPLLGVGLNRSVSFYAENPITDFFTQLHPTSFYRIHNTPLEIAAETGIPGAVLFIIFIVLSITSLRNKKITPLQRAACWGLISLFVFSLFHPFFHSSIFAYFFLLSALMQI